MEETQGTTKKNKNTWVIIVLIILAVMLVCCVVAVVGGLLLFNPVRESTADLSFLDSVGVQNEPFPLENFVPPSEDAFLMVERLSQVVVLQNDYRELGEIYLGEYDVPLTAPAKAYEIGDRENFWVTDNDSDEQFQITAVLRGVSPHVYFWIEDDVDYSETDLEALVDTFEYEIYPTNQEFFGQEWSPGIDEDEHLYLVYARGLGRNVAGYFSSIDSVHPRLQEFSNAHETFMINADAVSLDEDYTYSVLAHEHQHMIHWYQDRNETTWINEGFSELATVLSGFSPGGADMMYLSSPDVQLNTWPVDPNARHVHYGSSYLFMQYFLDRFGESATRALVTEDTNGLDSIDRVLAQIGETDNTEEVFIDWTLANFLDDPSLSDGEWAYDSYTPNILFGMGVNGIDCTDSGWTETTVAQFGVDQIGLQCEGAENGVLRFEGVGEVKILPEDPIEGKTAFWSNRGDESDMRLTRVFDLSAVSGTASLEYKVWFDLEESYDYAYVLLSEDGEHWTMAHTAHGTADNPVGSNYGWGYNGASNGWVDESLELSAYAGGKVWVRFNYITDAAVNGDGLMVDDMRLDAIGYASGFEADDGGWTAEGFARIENVLAQQFAVTIVKQSGTTTEVDSQTFYGGNTVFVPITEMNAWDEITVIISGLTRYTIQPANYRIQFMVEE